MGDVIVLAVLGIIVALVIRSMWKNHKKGGGCSGCSCNCGSCKLNCSSRTEKQIRGNEKRASWM